MRPSLPLYFLVLCGYARYYLLIFVRIGINFVSRALDYSLEERNEHFSENLKAVQIGYDYRQSPLRRQVLYEKDSADYGLKETQKNCIVKFRNILFAQ